jgi:hypothetical protein
MVVLIVFKCTTGLVRLLLTEIKGRCKTHDEIHIRYTDWNAPMHRTHKSKRLVIITHAVDQDRPGLNYQNSKGMHNCPCARRIVHHQAVPLLESSAVESSEVHRMSAV